MDEGEAKRLWSRAWSEMLEYEESSRTEGDPVVRARLIERWRMAAALLSELEEAWGPLGPVELAPSRPARSDQERIAAPLCGEEDRARA